MDVRCVGIARYRQCGGHAVGGVLGDEINRWVELVREASSAKRDFALGEVECLPSQTVGTTTKVETAVDRWRGGRPANPECPAHLGVDAMAAHEHLFGRVNHDCKLGRYARCRRCGGLRAWPSYIQDRHTFWKAFGDIDVRFCDVDFAVNAQRLSRRASH